MNTPQVKIQYKDKDLNVVSETTYSLEQYTGLLSNNILKIITDIEDLIYQLNNNLPKSEWNNATVTAFTKIRHKLLDEAGEIKRLPITLVLEQPQTEETDNENISSWINRLFRD